MLNKNDLNATLSYLSAQAKDVFKNHLDSVILYGSYARGDFDPESDIDIMIIADITEESINRFTSELRNRIYQYELENDCVISLCVVSKSIFERYKGVVPFYQNVIREGEELAV